jgi:hypothetical protein
LLAGDHTIPVVSSQESRVPDRDRAELVARLSQDLEYFSAPRLQLLLIMILAGGAAFLSSVLLLWSPAETFELMAPRYAAAALSGYLAFLLLIRVWIALHRPAGEGVDLDPLNMVDAIGGGPSTPSFEAPSQFAGGRSGGAGGSGSWGGGDTSGGSSGGGWSFDVDLDAAVWLLIAAAAAIAGLAAIGYVIYMAPVLLAEVALDAAIMSVLYRRLRRSEQGYWLTTVLRHTWVPAVVLVAFAFAAGFALQQVAPEARSIGAVVQSLSGTTAR